MSRTDSEHCAEASGSSRCLIEVAFPLKQASIDSVPERNMLRQFTNAGLHLTEERP